MKNDINYDMAEETNVRSSFMATNDLTAINATRMMSLSEELGLPKEVIRQDIPFAENELIARKVEKDKILSSWAGQAPENAAFVRDSATNMLHVNEQVDNIIAPPIVEEMGFFEEYFSNPWEKGKNQLRGIENARLYIETGDEQYKTEAAKYKLEAMQSAEELAWYEYLSPKIAVEQLPQLLEMLPKQIQRAGESGIIGASAAMIAGQIGPQVALPEEIISVPAMAYLASRSGWAVGTAESAFNLEKGAFAYELMDLKDENGQPIPRDVLNAFSTIYGVSASLVELAGEVTFINILESTGIGKIAQGTAKETTKRALKNALMDKTLQPILIDAAKSIMQGGVTGFVEEGTQKALSNVFEAVMKSYVGSEYETSFADKPITEGVLDEALAGLGASLWLGATPIGIKSAYEANNVKKQQNFTKYQNDIHNAIEELEIKRSSPELAESYINARFPQLKNEEVVIPSNALIELMQDDINLAIDLNIDLVKLDEYAKAGLDYPVSISKIHARLDSERYAKISEIMKVDAESYSVYDSAQIQNRVQEDNFRIEEIANYYQQVENELEFETDAFAQSLRENIESIPQLRKTAESSGGVDNYIATQTELLRRMTTQLAERTGKTPSEILSKISFGDGINNNMQDVQDETSAYNIQKPIFENIIGQLDRDEIARVNPQLANDIEARYGKSIFANRGKGKSIEAIANNLNISTDEVYNILSTEENLYTKSNRSKLRRQRAKERVASGEPEQVLFQFIGEQGAENLDIARSEEVLLAPNGKPSNLSSKLYATVRTDEFKSWFGDWENDPENASKVVDENGEPLVVYHGGADVNVFDTKKGTEGTTQFGQGGYFTNSRYYAQEFADERVGIVKDFFLNIKKPFETSDYNISKLPNTKEFKNLSNKIIEMGGSQKDINIISEWGFRRIPSILEKIGDASKEGIFGKTDEANRLIQSSGYDGIIGDYNEVFQYVAFSPNQIKSIENRGTFSTESDNIYYQAEKQASARGSIQKLSDDNYIINLFDNANLSTITHELSHFFFLEMQALEDAGLADDTLVKDMQSLRAWLGVERNADITVEQQEQLARGFEQYLREGKAPVSNLRDMFSRFSRWFKSIYKHALSLNVQLNDEVRNVFDRMIATEQEIEQAANKNTIVQFTTKELDSLGFTDNVKALFNSLTGAIKEEAEAKLNQARNRARAELKNKITQEVNKELDEMQVYKTRATINADGLDKESVIAVKGEEFANSLARKLKRSKGKSAQEIAVEMGYDSVDLMLDDVFYAEPKTSLRNKLVEERMSYEDAQYVAEDVLFETNALIAQEQQIASAIAKKIGIAENEVMKDVEVKAYAKNVLFNMSLREATKPSRFLSTARSIYKKEREALIREDYENAYTYNSQARINMSMAQQSKKIVEDVQKLQKQIDRFLKNKKANPVAKYAVNTLAYKYGMQKLDMRLAEGKDNNSIVEWATENDVYLDGNLFSADMINYLDMSYNGFSILEEQLQTIIYMEREARMIETEQGKIEMQELANDIQLSIAEHNTKAIGKQFTDENKLLSGLKFINASLLKIDTITRLLDGDKLGIVWENVYNRINLATFDLNSRVKVFKTQLNELFSSYTPKELKDIRKNKFVVEGFTPEAITKETALMIALNVGNAGNRTRLKNGYPVYGKDEAGKLTDQQIDAVLGTLSEKDWNFIQSIWDHFETYQKESFDLEEQMTGVRPIKVEATPIETKYGTFRGGYFPIVYDSKKSGKAPKGYEPENQQNKFSVPSVPHGSMKERQGEGLKQVPLRLNLDIIPENIVKTIHNLSFRKPVKEVSRILRNDIVRSAIESTAGVEQYKALLDWLVDVAGGSPSNFSGFDGFANWARTSQSVMSMGYKLSTTLTQLAGTIHAIPEIGIKYVLGGVIETAWNLPKLKRKLDEVMAKSKIMKYRIENVERDVADYNKKILYGGNKTLQTIKENAFTPMGYVQLVTVDLPVWLGAYQKGLKDYNGNEKQAIKYADNAVEITQGSGATKDLAKVQRGSEWQKLATMYYTFFSAVYQMQYRRTTMLARKKDMASAWNLANYFIVGMVLSNIASEYLAGRGYDDEEDENFAEWVAKSNLMYTFQSIPVLRDLANGLLGDYGYSLSPAQSAPEAVLRGLKKIGSAADSLIEGESDIDLKDIGLSAMTATGYITKNPLFGNQATGMAREFLDYLDNTDPEFEAWRILLGKKN